MEGRVSQRVAVIGAGPSGLATVKELLEEGHDPVCFERAASLGGVFRSGEDDGVCWDSCRLTSSGLLTAFSDFPVPPERAGHMTAGEYVDYLTAYSGAFGVTGRIRFGVSVEAVRQRTGGGWDVRTVTAGGLTHDESFDAVAVCSGRLRDPHLPRFPGEETFTGQFLHGSDYRRPAQVVGRRVLVVGGGESAADIVAEAARHADETTLSLRRGVAVRPRTIRGLPSDHQTTRLNHSPSHWIYQTRHPRDGSKRRAYKVVFFPLLVLERLLQSCSVLLYELLPIVIRRDAS